MLKGLQAQKEKEKKKIKLINSKDYKCEKWEKPSFKKKTRLKKFDAQKQVMAKKLKRKKKLDT